MNPKRNVKAAMASSRLIPARPWHGARLDHKLCRPPPRANRGHGRGRHRTKGSNAIVRHRASTAPFLAAARIVDVLVPVALDQSYSYRVPAGLDLAPGDVVRVPLGARETTGGVGADNGAGQPRLHNRPRGGPRKPHRPPPPPEPRPLLPVGGGSP